MISFGSFSNVECTLADLTIYDSDYGFSVWGSSEVLVDNCIVYSNDESGAMISSNADVQIQDCVFKYNYPAGVEDYSSSVEISGSVFYGNGQSGWLYNAAIASDGGTVRNCTIVSNNNGVVPISANATGPTITSSIVYSNTNDQIDSNITNVTYSCVEDGYTGTGNISSDPQFVDASNQDYSLKWNSTGLSPCIDTGNPSYTDPDGTRSDMGGVRAIDHAVETYSYQVVQQRDFYYWKCYPVLDDVYTANNNASDFFYDVELQLSYLSHDGDVSTGTGHGRYYPWEATDPTDPLDGFKIRVSSAASMTKTGFLADPDTQIYLTAQAEYHWVGYFLEESQHPIVALQDIRPFISEIKHHNWALTKVGSTWYFSGACMLNYGDMVEIRCDTSCSFAWNDHLSRGAPYVKEPTSYYIYDEDPDYIPIYLDLSAYEENLPLEIGMFADGELIGATVVDGLEVQVNAYVDDIENLDDVTVNFEFYYGDRIEPCQCAFYAVDSDLTDGFVTTTKLFETESRYYRVTLGEGGDGSIIPDLPKTVSMNNYPNPFNPETTISYSLPQDGQAVLKVYNLRGQLVKTLVNSEMEGGEHEVVWSGQDESGKTVSSGIYFLRMQTGGKTLTHKLMLLK